MKKWYKDKEFPEIKDSNSKLVAVIPNPHHLDKVIREHNKLYKRLLKLESDLNRADEIILDIHAQTSPHSKYSASKVNLWKSIRENDATPQLKRFSDKDLQSSKNTIKFKVETLESTDDDVFLSQFVKEYGAKYVVKKKTN